MPDAPGRAVDQHAAALADVGGVHQGLPGGEADHGYGGGLDVVEAVRLWDEDSGRADGVLGVSAVAVREGQHAEHLVAGRVEGHSRADGFHRAGDVPAEHERRLADEQAAIAVHRVDRVHARRVHTDGDLADAGLGGGEGDDLEDLRSAELVLADGLHRVVHVSTVAC